MMSTNDILEQGIAALKAGQKAEARHLLEQVVQQDKDNETAWLWLSGAVDTDRERIYCLRETLRINPNNQHARRGLGMLESKAPTPRPAQPVERKLTQPPPIREEKKHDIRPIRAVEKPPPDDTKQCPYCAETIKAQAVVCRFCGRNLKTGQPASQPPKATIQQAPKKKKKSGSRTALLVLAILVACVVCYALGQGESNDRLAPKPKATPSSTTVTPGPTATRWTSSRYVTSHRGVQKGMAADDVLEVWGKALRTEVVGEDTQGLIVEWVYADAVLVMARRTADGVTCYRVIQIRLR